MIMCLTSYPRISLFLRKIQLVPLLSNYVTLINKYIYYFKITRSIIVARIDAKHVTVMLLLRKELRLVMFTDEIKHYLIHLQL